MQQHMLEHRQWMEACRNEQVVFRECQQGFEEEINKPPVPYNIIITKNE